MREQTLHLIDLDIQQLGYFKFISSWLYTGPEGNFLIDPGPACAIPILVQKLVEKGVNDLDWVLLTHIHQDHAGGLGQLIEQYPDMNVVCHSKGARHLADPTRLWEGSKKILGDVADVYGEILPVPENKIRVLDTVPFGPGIKVIPTPGHASHHQCYVFKDWFFAGELFGAHVPLQTGLYLRPATPHRFILEEYLVSMDLVEPLLKDTICFAHYGMANNSKLILKTARRQLQLWVEIIQEQMETQEMDEMLNVLLENDPTFARYHELDRGMQEREWHFSINSIHGIMKYIESR